MAHHPHSFQKSSRSGSPKRPYRCLRIGVFFDGTNNNGFNASIGDGKTEDGEPPFSGRERNNDSYNVGVTNIWRLYNLYPDDLGGEVEDPIEDFHLRLYIDGIGTSAGRSDTPWPGQAFGTGKTGIWARTTTALAEQLPRLLDRFMAMRRDVVDIEALEFDVFGFSRGAAAARHFVNEVNEGTRLESLLHVLRPSLIPEFSKSTRIGVRFLGLYDTVSAHGSLADGWDIRDGRTGALRLALPSACASHVVHLCARDEVRANFALTSVGPAYPDTFLPGVHSDIGGGYKDLREGPLRLTKPLYSIDRSPRYLGHAFAPDVRHSAAWQEVEKLRKTWEERLGGIDSTQLEVESWSSLSIPRGRHDRTEIASRIYATLRLHRAIDWRYQFIPLRMMHGLAQKAAVKFKELRLDPTYEIPSELEVIAHKLITKLPLSQEEDRLLRRKYLHVSAHWGCSGIEALGPNPMDLDLAYINRPTPSGERTIILAAA